MEKTRKTRKHIPYETAQLLYGVSIFLTFGAVAFVNCVLPG